MPRHDDLQDLAESQRQDAVRSRAFRAHQERFAAVQDAPPAGVRSRAERAAADFRIIDIPRERPGVFVSWSRAAFVLVPLAVLVVAMVYLLARGWPW